METIQMTFSGWILKQTAVSILLGNEKERTIDIYIYKKTLWIDIKGIVLIKKSQSQEIVTVYVWFHLYITYLKWQSYRDREQISCFLGFIKGAERGEEREQKKCSLFWE